MATTNAADIVIPKFHDVLGDVMAHGHTHYWLHSGRGPTKSSFISLTVVLLLVANPLANAVVIRRFSNTLRDSVYQQILWAVDALRLNDWFKAKVSPMEITYVPTGQRIVSRGADDPLKLKSLKMTHGYVAVTWFEELDQFEGIEAIRSILNSLRRGGDVFWIFYSYNPPKSAWNWVNEGCLERLRRSDALVRQSSYLDVIESHPEWIDKPFIDEAEYLRDTSEMAWRWEYLGEVTGTGGNVFDNIVSEKLSDARILGFERRRNGIDWGWLPDPWRFVRCAWEPAERRLVIYQELSANRKTSKETGAMVAEALTYADASGEEPYFHDEMVWCDNTPDGQVSMSVYRRECGLRARPLRKSNMRRVSYDWLAGLRDKDGRWIDEIPDGNDHSIDAVRYAVMEDVLRGN